jgi:hypothetical protein
LVEFGKTVENCSDEEIEIALHDMLTVENTNEVKLFDKDDPNEPIDYKRYPRISKGQSINSADIKNCYITRVNNIMIFSIEVFDLSDIDSNIEPTLNKVNFIEWYINFENLIIPDERLDISYKIAAHIEPKNPIWEFGKGVLGNLREIFSNIRDRNLINSFKKEVYLWIKPPNQSIYFPLPLRSGNISFDKNNNKINILVSLDELRDFGIATQVGAFELPAKLSNFSAGVRYYQTSILKRPGRRITANLTFLLNKIDKIRTRPILGIISSRILQKYGDITCQ